MFNTLNKCSIASYYEDNRNIGIQSYIGLDNDKILKVYYDITSCLQKMLHLDSKSLVQRLSDKIWHIHGVMDID